MIRSFSVKIFIICLILLSFSHTSTNTSSFNYSTSTITPQATSIPVIHDGIISPNEYAFQVSINSASGFNLYYSINQSTIYVAIEANAQGWIAVGFGSVNKMQGSDIIIGYVDQFGITYVTDNWGTAPTGHTEDTTSQNILSFAGSQVGGKTVIEFSRYLNTNDVQDNVIPIGSAMTVIWAYSNTDDNTSYHTARGTTSITFQTSTPSEPRQVSAFSGDTYVYLTWNTPLSDGGSSITNYQIQSSSTSGGPYTNLGTTSQLSYNDTGLTNNNNYYYVISAINTNGKGTDSAEILGQPSLDLTPPMNLHVVSSSNQVELAWDIPQNNGGFPILYYNVYRSTVTGGPYSLIGTSSNLQYIDDTTTNGLNYYYTIRAVNTIKEGMVSLELMATPIGVAQSPQKVIAIPSSSNITLTWQAPNLDGGLPIQNYSIYRSTQQFGAYTYIGSNSSAYGYVDLTVVTLNTYYYSITSVNSAGESVYSTAVKVKAASVPYTVLTINTSPGYNTVFLNWSQPFDNGFGITNYNIYKAASENGPYFLADTTVASNYTDLTVNNGDTIYYKISAVNNQGEGSLSNSIVSTPGTVPDTPRDFTAYPNNRRVTLIWQVPQQTGGYPIINYKLYRKSFSNPVYTLIFSNNSLNFIDRNVTNEETYDYEVSAINSMGESTKIAIQNIIPSTPPTQLQDIQLNFTNDTVKLTWGVPTVTLSHPIVGYKIYRTYNTSLSYTLLDQTTSGLDYTDSALVLGKKAYYVVTAFNTIGESIFSDPVSIFPASAPLPIQNLVAVSGNNRISLLWSAPLSDGGLPILGYHVYRTDSQSDFSDYTLIANTTSTQYHDLTVKNGEEYKYYITAENQIGVSIDSNIVSSTPTSVGVQEVNNPVQSSANGNQYDQIFLTLSIIVSIVLMISTTRFLKNNLPSNINRPQPSSQDSNGGYRPLTQPTSTSGDGTSQAASSVTSAASTEKKTTKKSKKKSTKKTTKKESTTGTTTKRPSKRGTKKSSETKKTTKKYTRADRDWEAWND